MTPPERDLARRLGIDEGQGIRPRAGYLRVVFDALIGAGFDVVGKDAERAGTVFVWIVIHDYDSFGALNGTAGIASGPLFNAVDILKADGILADDAWERTQGLVLTERGRLAAYLVRATLEDYASGSGSGA